MERDEPERRLRSPVKQALEETLALTLVLWTIEVLVNLKLWTSLFIARVLPTTGVDLLGLLLAQIQIALCLVLGVRLLAPVLARVLPGAGSARERRAMLGAAPAALVMLACARFEWGFQPGKTLQSLAVAGIVGILLWGFLRLLPWARREAPGTGPELFAWMSLPALVLGFVGGALARLTHGQLRFALITAVPALFSLGLVPLAWRARPRALRVGAHMIPSVAALLLGGHAVWVFRSYGETPAGEQMVPGGAERSIVLIVLDTLRADHLQRYGYSRNTMPFVEAWADGAMVFKRAVAAAGWTFPSHASMFTGQPVSLHGIHYSGSSAAAYYTRPVDGLSWLPREVAKEGLIPLAMSANPVAIPAGDYGFQRVLNLDRGAWWKQTLAGLIDDHVLPFMRSLNENLRWRMPYVSAADMVEIVQRATPDAPVFLFVNLLDAHHPYNPPASALRELGLDPPPLFGRYQFQYELPLSSRGDAAAVSQSIVDLYDGELRGMDKALARLLDWIDEALGEETIVIVTSDHGELLGEDGLIGHEYGLSQALIHVPLFVRDRRLGAGEIEAVVTTRAIYDYILGCARGEPAGIDRLVAEDEFGIVSERYVSGSMVELMGASYDRPWVALFEGDLKALGPSSYGAEVHNVAHDFVAAPLEASDAARSDTLADRVDAYWHTHWDRREASGDAQLSNQELDRLRALGYIQ
ncbi:MAG: hypothetical protein CME06_01550 [Gemmatimonadetes bacterium]|nr:hypothetical protein [Gemmatimonadota bacterium]